MGKRSLGVLVFLIPISLMGETWQVKPHLDSLVGTPYEISFWKKGLTSVSKIRFRSGATNQYQPFLNRLTLEKGLDDGARRIRRIEDTSRMGRGIVAHEAFHAFVANHMNWDREYRDMKNWYEARAHNLYWEIPRSKRLVAYEEAIATFLGDTITAYATSVDQLERARRSPDQERCERFVTISETFWNQHWAREFFGYYYRDSVSEYWVDTAKSLWARLRGEYPEVGGPIFVEDQSLTMIDKLWASRELLESRFVPEFETTFADALNEVSCDHLPPIEE